MKAKLCIATALLALTACRTTGTSSSVKDDAPATDTQVQPDPKAVAEIPIAEPFAKGEANGIEWEARFNLPPCDHPPHKKGAWCNFDDSKPAAAASGVEDRIRQWVNDPTVKSVQLAYFSFSNKPMLKILCDAANARDMKITAYIHRQNMTAPVTQQLATCSPNLKVEARGTEFGNGYLQHAKIIMASKQLDPLPLHLVPEEQRAEVAEAPTRWTSGSANMSASGTSLHLDNWLFFTSKSDDHVAQENVCFFYAMRTMEIGQGVDERLDFAKRNKACLDGIQAPLRDDIVFYPVPHENITRAIYPKVKAAIDNAQSEIKVVIHRLTTAQVYNPLVKAKQRGVDVKVIVDDDTLRVGKCNGGSFIDQVGSDVQANRTMRGVGIPVTYIDTNGEVGQLAHNKFMVFDHKLLLQGAGNFTATSLNSTSPGNIEDFYIITVPEIVDAYSRAWDELHSRSTELADHEVGNNQDANLKQGQFGFDIDRSNCN